MRLKILLIAILLGVSPVIYADGEGLLKACFALFTSPKSETEIQIANQEQQAWSALQPKMIAEVSVFRSLTNAEKIEYLEKVSAGVMEYLQTTFQTANLGFHYNLHGGTRDSYITSGGIYATQGDIATNLGHARDFSKKVYFFQSQAASLFHVLNTSNPNYLFPRFRMGQALVIFDLNAPIMKQLEADGVITNKQSILFEVNENAPKAIKNQSGSLIGVPTEAFVLPPLSVFNGISAKSGISRTNWDEQTLIMMRFIEQVARDQTQKPN